MNDTLRAAIEKQERKRRAKFAKWLAIRTPAQEAEATTRRAAAEARFDAGTPISDPPPYDPEP